MVCRELGLSDQTSRNWIKAFGMTCSMSLTGNCWDNAPRESWFNRFKNERVHGIRYATHANMRAVSFVYIKVFYNRKRQHLTLGYKSQCSSWNTGSAGSIRKNG